MWRALGYNTREGLWFIDNDALTMDINPAMGAILGRPKEDVIGRSIFDFVDDENHEIFLEQIRLRALGADAAYEISLLRPDGTLVPCINKATPLLRDGQKVGSVGMWTDISDLRRATKELVATLDRVESESQAKSEFLSSMSHELRTPLHAILGWTQLLLNEPKEPSDSSHVKGLARIQESGKHLVDLIDQLLELSRLETGNLDLRLEDVDVDEIVHDCLNAIQPFADENRITINLPLPKRQSATADRVKLKQCLLNLLSNAVKYSTSGGTVNVRTSSAPSGNIRIEVQDSGSGIPDEMASQLFEPFKRLGREKSEIEGAGIGLTITKNLVEAMYGTIGFESTVGLGSLFWIELPQGANLGEAVSTISTGFNSGKSDFVTDLSGLRLLYVEDNTANMELMIELVSRLNAKELIPAISAEIGIELAKQKQPDIILMDIDLPGMSGIEALHCLGDLGETKSIPVLAVSAAASRHDIELAEAAGFDGYVTKPFNLRLLCDSIVKLTLNSQP